jgi:serine/threonine-protein kinase
MARTTLTSLPSSESSQAPMWSPDGKRVVYRATRTGFRNIFERTADGSDDETRLTTSQTVQTPGSFSADGKQFIFTDIGIWVLSLDAEPKSTQLWKTSYSEWNPHLSRDGRWLAYTSRESGRAEIYVRPFPKLDGKWKISIDGGTEPVWSRDGRELFYRNNSKMMVVNVAAGAAFSAGVPQVLFEGRYQFSGTAVSGYDVSPDGKSFLMVQPAESVQPASQISIVLNWSQELNSLTSTHK